MENITVNTTEHNLLLEIRHILNEARKRTYAVANSEMVLAYWNVGKLIVEAQGGAERAAYGDGLLKRISKQLTAEFGKGFDTSNLRHMRLFYIAFPNCDALRHELSWTHYRLLSKVDNPKAREYYAEEAAKGLWSTR